jgi:hypothetical protein
VDAYWRSDQERFRHFEEPQPKIEVHRIVQVLLERTSSVPHAAIPKNGRLHHVVLAPFRYESQLVMARGHPEIDDMVIGVYHYATADDPSGPCCALERGYHCSHCAVREAIIGIDPRQYVAACPMHTLVDRVTLAFVAM